MVGPQTVFEQVPLHERIIIDAAELHKNKPVPEVFDKLSYGPAPEANDAVEAWYVAVPLGCNVARTQFAVFFV